MAIFQHSKIKTFAIVWCVENFENTRLPCDLFVVSVVLLLWKNGILMHLLGKIDLFVKVLAKQCHLMEILFSCFSFSLIRKCAYVVIFFSSSSFHTNDLVQIEMAVSFFSKYREKKDHTYMYSLKGFKIKLTYMCTYCNVIVKLQTLFCKSKTCVLTT